MKNMMLIGIASAVLLGGVMKPVPSFAQQGPVTDTYVSVVRTSDLNLRTTEGRRQLYRRIAAAAREVCGTASELDLLGKNEVHRCPK